MGLLNIDVLIKRLKPPHLNKAVRARFLRPVSILHYPRPLVRPHTPAGKGKKRLSRLVDDSILLRFDYFVVILVLVVVMATLWCRGRGRGACWCMFVCVVVVIMISSSCIIGGGLNLRGCVRTFFGLLTNRVVSFRRRRQGQGTQITEPLLLAPPEPPDFVRDLVLGVPNLVFDDVLLVWREFPGAVILVIVRYH